MISRRNYLTIFLMMMILLFMFQFSQIVKENGNDYDTNEYSVENLPTGETAFVPRTDLTITDCVENDYVLYVGSETSEIMPPFMEWCTYTKKDAVISDHLSAAMIMDGRLPVAIVVDGRTADVDDLMDGLNAASEKGVIVIFGRLPDAKVVASNEELQSFLGITEVREEMTDIKGMHLFSGFLLGGDMVYMTEDAKDAEKYQDFELKIPWYVVGKGTKSYMVGIKDETVVKNEEFPRIIWRNNTGTSMVYAVNGDFCENLTGLGIYDACLYEARDYSLYPVVNAQCISLVNYPSMAAENDAVIETIYGRKAKSVQRDIMWPSIYSMAANNDLQMTCFIQTEYNYDDNNYPEDDQLVFYLQQFKEADVEAGMAFNYVGDTTYSDKYALDKVFYREAGIKYQFGAAYVDEVSDDWKSSFEGGNLYGITTFTCKDRKELPLLTYYTDDVTSLGITGNVTEYTFQTDLQLRSLETALGYTNVLVDMKNVLWPEKLSDQWQHYFEQVVGNMDTFFAKYIWFEPSALSTADERTRTMLNLDYDQMSVENSIILRVHNVDRGAYFLLRTHGQKIDLIEGADYEEIEPDVYLIHTRTKYIVLALTKSDDIVKYDGLF